MNFIIDVFTWIIRLLFGLIIIIVSCVPSWLLWRLPQIKKWRESTDGGNSILGLAGGIILILLIIIVLPVVFVLLISFTVDPTGKIMEPIFSILGGSDI